MKVGSSGSPIKSIQRGLSSSGAVTIASVNPEKSVVHFNSAFGRYNAGSGETAVKGYLVNETTLQIAGYGSHTFAWEVIEYV